MADTINLEASQKIISVQGLDHYHEKAMNEVDEKISKISRTGVGAKGTGAYAEVFNDTDNNIAWGDYSHAEGGSTKTLGSFSHAEGESTVANGADSHVGGYKSQANAIYSFVHGYEAEATQPNEVAFGTYNQSNTDTLFSLGNGTDENNKSNAFEITKTTGKLFDKEIAIKEDIPVTLPANGGNADTVGGKTPQQFMQYIGIQSDTTVLNDTNYKINYIADFGETVATAMGLPVAGWHHIMYLMHTNTGYGCQIAFPLNFDGKAYWRIALGTTWGAWKNIADGGDAGTVDGRHSGRIATCNENGVYYSTVAEHDNDAILQWDGVSSFRLKTLSGFNTSVNSADTTSRINWQLPDAGTDVLTYAESAQPYQRTYARILNSPSCPTGYDTSDNDFFYVIDALTTDWLTILAKDTRSNQMYMNTKTTSGWSGWRSMADGGNADTSNTADTAGSQATVSSNICLRNMSSGSAVATTANCSVGAWYGQYE